MTEVEPRYLTMIILKYKKEALVHDQRPHILLSFRTLLLLFHLLKQEQPAHPEQ